MKQKLQLVTAFMTGLLFAAGLAVGGMTQPAKVVGFLDLTGDWDPSLAFVMAGAVAVHFVAYRVAFRMRSPWLAEGFGIPSRHDLSPRLLAGSALFGLGWGLAGYCPGPGLTASVTGAAAPLVFVAAMAAGMLAYRVFDARLERQRVRVAVNRASSARMPSEATR